MNDGGMLYRDHHGALTRERGKSSVAMDGMGKCGAGMYFNVPVCTLAEYLGVSPTRADVDRVVRLYREKLGETPGDWFNARRQELDVLLGVAEDYLRSR